MIGRKIKVLFILCFVTISFSLFSQQVSASCIAYTQPNQCSTQPDGPITKNGTTFIVDKCGNPPAYSCYDPARGQYYTQPNNCAVGPFGNISIQGHLFLVRKLTVSGQDYFSCVGDCTANPSLPHCPASAATATPTNTPSPTPLIGDVNGDGVVNVVDYSLIVGCYGNKFGTSDCVAGSKADVNNDGVVDGIDYNVWLRAFIGVE